MALFLLQGKEGGREREEKGSVFVSSQKESLTPSHSRYNVHNHCLSAAQSTHPLKVRCMYRYTCGINF